MSLFLFLVATKATNKKIKAIIAQALKPSNVPRIIANGKGERLETLIFQPKKEILSLIGVVEAGSCGLLSPFIKAII